MIHYENAFLEVEITNWKDVFKFDLETMTQFVYRGQRNSVWKLTSKLDRRNFGSVKDPEKKVAIEAKMLNHFKEIFPNGLDYSERYALTEYMCEQHGRQEQTRILDFSNSFFVALFFAVIDAKGESAVFAINRLELYIEALKTNLVYGLQRSHRELEDINRRIAAQFFTENLYSGLIILDAKSKRHNNLLHQTVHLVPKDNNLTFYENITHDVTIKNQRINCAELTEKIRSCTAIKFIIPFNVRKDILKYLNMINVTGETLFPYYLPD